ncbi:MAG TPA: hypothetical protein VF704_04875 [Allosphingosinicella sp.]|jgi:hypothetical protein
MKALKYLTGAAAAAALTVGAAAPAEAQYWDRRDRGVDIGDIATGIAVVGGIAALINAFDGRGGSAYGYGNAYGYGYGYGNAYGYGDPRYGYGYNRSYGYDPRYGNSRVGYGYGHGSAQAAVNACGAEAQRYGRNVTITDLDRDRRGYRVRGRIDTVDVDGRGWNRRYDVDREDFTCYASNGRIFDFRV